jgi:hypothetical protein
MPKMTQSYLLDRVFAIERADTKEAKSFRSTFDKRVVLSGGVQGGIIMGIIVKALSESQKGTQHPDMKSFHLTFLGSPKVDRPFRINIRVAKASRSFAFLEGEMEEDGVSGAPYIRWTAIFADLSAVQNLEVRHAPGTFGVAGQTTSPWYDAFHSDLLGGLNPSSTSRPSFKSLPSFWDAAGPGGWFGQKASFFTKLLDYRLGTPEMVSLFKAQLGSNPDPSWPNRNIAFLAGSPDGRPVDPAFLAFVAETPSWTNSILPPGLLKTKKSLMVPVLSFSLVFFGKVPPKEALLVRNHHSGIVGDVQIPETTVWDKDTGRLLMIGHAMSLARVVEPRPNM